MHVSPGYTRAREQLHAIAEWLLAGPQHARSATIRLQIRDGAVATVADPDVSVGPAGLTTAGTTLPLQGTIATLGAAAGLPVERPQVTYSDPAPGGPDLVLDADPADTAAVIAAYTAAGPGLADLSAERAVLWPEHFDLAVRVDDVNYGVSPGDSFSSAPYAYVGPDEHDDDDFFNAPFGAYLVFDPAHHDASADIARFFGEGRVKVRAARGEA